MTEKSLKNAVGQFVTQKGDYYKQWFFDEPLIIGEKHVNDLSKLQKIIRKLIREFVLNYDSYKNLMPLSEKSEKIISLFNSKSYQIGTYRTDFVYDETNQVKLIEITCRFALNTLFLSAVGIDHSEKFINNHKQDFLTKDLYEDLIPYMESLYAKHDNIFLLKGSDKKNASTYFTKIFRNAGREIIELDIDEIEQNLSLMSTGWIISELTLEEIESLPIEIIETLVNYDIINDFRTVLLVHDKRFFSVLTNKDLQVNSLSPAEINFLSSYIIPTYTFDQCKEKWEHAKNEKDKWILKHRSLGKSKSIYAGVVTEQADWENLFSLDNLEDYVLQEWVPQKRIYGEIKQEKYEDYVTGTLLFFDDNFFGFGPFRTSSFPVTNVTDDRKVTSVILAEEVENAAELFINYIQ